MPKDQATQKMASTFQGLSLVTAPKDCNGLAGRPDHGKAGEQVKVKLNAFPILPIDEDLMLQQHDVTIRLIKKVKEGQAPLPGEEPPAGPIPMPDRNRCYAIINRLAQAANPAWERNKWIYDGQKLLYTVSNVGGWLDDLVRTEVTLQDREITSKPGEQVSGRITYEVVIKSTSTLAVGAALKDFLEGRSLEVPRQAVQALDVALKQTAQSKPGNRILGRGVYTQEGATDISDNVQAWQGYTQSLTMGQGELMLTMDAAVQGVPVVVPLIKWMARQLRRQPEDLGRQGLSHRDVEELNRIVASARPAINISVTHRVGPAKQKLRGFTPTSAEDSKFELRDGSKLSVADYFRESRKKPLQMPRLPCAIVGGSKKPEWLPVEVCQVLPEQRALRAEETTAILRQAATKPDVRSDKILKTLLNRACLHTDKTAQAFGIHLKTGQTGQPEMLQLNARVLPPPCLQYGGDKHMNPGGKGDWNVMDLHLLQTAKLSSYGVVYCGGPKYEPHISGFINALEREMRDKGVQLQMLAKPPIEYCRKGYPVKESLDKVLHYWAGILGKDKNGQDKKPDIVFVVQEHERQVYDHVKLICDTQLGVQSQLCAASKLRLDEPHKLGSKLKGMVLKVNNKLGGDSWALSGTVSDWCPALKSIVPPGEARPPRVMLMGAELSHGMAGEVGGQRAAQEAEKRGQPATPTIAAVVASLNAGCTRYASRMYKQAALDNTISNLDVATRELVSEWYKANSKTLPEVIIMFRGGCSEGEFSKVLEVEAHAILKGCRRIQGPDGNRLVPKLVFVTIQKRHALRMFPGERNAEDTSVGGRSGNVRPGTVVDTGVCSPSLFDFYLNSHAGIQGTNKPAKYTVLKDDVGFTADSMQLLCFWLCHTFVRCTRTVSACPPAYYAGVAARRGAMYLQRKDLTPTNFDTMSMASGGSGSSGEQYSWEFATVHKDLCNTMYFI